MKGCCWKMEGTIHRLGRIKHKTCNAYKYAKMKETSPPFPGTEWEYPQLFLLIAALLPLDLYTLPRRHNSSSSLSLIFYDLMAQVVAALVFISPSTMLSSPSISWLYKKCTAPYNVKWMRTTSEEKFAFWYHRYQKSRDRKRAASYKSWPWFFLISYSKKKGVSFYNVRCIGALFLSRLFDAINQSTQSLSLPLVFFGDRLMAHKSRLVLALVPLFYTPPLRSAIRKKKKVVYHYCCCCCCPLG